MIHRYVLFLFSSGHQRRCELFNTTDLTWTVLTPLNLGRGQHACTWFQGNIVAAGGWAIVSKYYFDLKVYLIILFSAIF